MTPRRLGHRSRVPCSAWLVAPAVWLAGCLAFPERAAISDSAGATVDQGAAVVRDARLTAGEDASRGDRRSSVRIDHTGADSHAAPITAQPVTDQHGVLNVSNTLALAGGGSIGLILVALITLKLWLGHTRRMWAARLAAETANARLRHERALRHLDNYRAVIDRR
ncbi:MAG: hypothetical protein ACE5F9_04545 [Phycisphaerae bacterium]